MAKRATSPPPDSAAPKGKATGKSRAAPKTATARKTTGAPKTARTGRKTAASAPTPSAGKTAARPARRTRRAAPAALPPPAGVPADVPNVVEREIDATPDQPFAEGVQDTLDPDLRYRMISEAAYRHYMERGYEDGYDLDDWLQAEAEVDHLLLNRPGR